MLSHSLDNLEIMKILYYMRVPQKPLKAHTLPKVAYSNLISSLADVKLAKTAHPLRRKRGSIDFILKFIA